MNAPSKSFDPIVQGAIRTFMLSNDMDIIKVCVCWDFVLVDRSM